MLSKLRSIFSSTPSKQTAPPPAHTGDFKPDSPFYVIGDLHGCMELFQDALEKIDAHAMAAGHTAPSLVLLGDYIDRGPQSAQVLARIFEMQQDNPEHVICLMGNHEKMMFEFIDDPAGRGTRWLKFGGRDTLQSYGLNVAGKNMDAEDLTELSMELEAAMPAGLLDWMRNLPVRYQNGNIVCVHAAMSPRKPLEKQDDRVLLWGHPDFMSTPRQDGLWVAHGHTIVKTAGCQNSRIALDTGAYQTGTLSVAALSEGQCAFL